MIVFRNNVFNTVFYTVSSYGAMGGREKASLRFNMRMDRKASEQNSAASYVSCFT